MFGVFEELGGRRSGFSGPALVRMFDIFDELDGTGSRPLCSASLKSLTERGPAPYVRHL